MTGCKKRALNIIINSEKGFSLVEISITLAILAILSYAAVTELTTSSSMVKEKSLAQKIISDVRYAQEMALSYRKEVKFNISIENDSYSLKWLDDSYLKTPIGEQDFIFTVNNSEFSGMNFTDSGFSAGMLSFDSNGKPKNNGSLLTAATTLVTLNNSISIKIVPGTGSCFIQD